LLRDQASKSYRSYTSPQDNGVAACSSDFRSAFDANPGFDDGAENLDGGTDDS
jgi:hypothetical protein